MKVKYENQYYTHFCPGCNDEHLIPNFDGRPHWNFNGDFEKPTFTPSVLHRLWNKNSCHYFITDGYIKYCSDCNHNLAGQSVELPDLTETVLE
jgi:hypothetical protein